MITLLKDKRVIVGFVLILLIGLTLRLIKLGLLPVFADEAIYIRWAQIMANEATLRFLPLSDGKQPLFMWILMFYVKYLQDPLIAGRLLSVVSGVGTMIGIFALSFALFKSKWVPLIAMFLWAISPFAVFFDRMALVDSMLTMFAVWTFTLGVLTVKTERLDLAMMTGVALGAAWLTKSPAIFFVMLLPSTWILIKNKKSLVKLVLLYAVTFGIAYGIYNIQRLGPNFHLLAQRNLDYVYPYTHILESPLDPLKGHMGGIWRYFVALLPFSALVLMVVGAIVNFKKNPKEILLLLLWSFGPILIVAEFSKVVTARYILFAIPFIFVLAASTVLAGKNLGKIGFLILLAFVFQSLVFNYKLLTNPATAPLPQGERSGYLEEWTAGQGIREVAEYVKKVHAKDPATQIVVGTEGYFGTLPNGLEMYLQGVPNTIVKGVGLAIAEIPDSLKESKEAGNKTYLVVNKSRFVGDADKLGLRQIASYPKPTRAVGSMEYNLFGPQESLLFFEVTR